MIKLSVLRNDEILVENEGKLEARLLFPGQFSMGDRILLQADAYPKFVWFSPEETLPAAWILLTGPYEYPLPKNEDEFSRFTPRSFSGEKHYLFAREAYPEEIGNYRDLAKNPADCHENRTAFPHTFANAETRGEAQFFATNATNGININFAHGHWPYASWGIDGRDDAEITVDFGRPVDLDKVVIYLRGDWPHDNWWEYITVSFSDGTKEVAHMKKTTDGQEVVVNLKGITWFKLSELIKSDDPSPYPSLTAVEAWGREVQ